MLKNKKVQFKMEQSDIVEKAIKECVKEHHIDTGARVAGLMVYPYISKTIAGRCVKADKRLKFFTDYDFVIEISNEFWQNVTEETRKILIHHECLHMGARFDKNGNISYHIVNHDVEDFAEIIEKYGIAWWKEINLIKDHLQDPDYGKDSGEGK